MAHANPDGTWTLSNAEYQELRADQRKLTALENRGVDNWEGYGPAVRALTDEEEF